MSTRVLLMSFSVRERLISFTTSSASARTVAVRLIASISEAFAAASTALAAALCMLPLRWRESAISALANQRRGSFAGLAVRRRESGDAFDGRGGRYSLMLCIWSISTVDSGDNLAAL